MIPAGPHLVVAAHPDDEVLGAGGWMARYPGALVAILSEGTSAQGPVPDEWTDPAMLLARWSDVGYYVRLDSKRQGTVRALKGLDAKLVCEGQIPDQRMERYALEIATWVGRLVKQLRPTVVLTHCPTDLNRDHRVVAEAVAVACRPYASDVRLVLGFAVDVFPQPSRFTAERWNVFLPLTDGEAEMKMRACAEYGDEILEAPHPRSLYGIDAVLRMAGVQAGALLAEPYTLLWGRL